MILQSSSVDPEIYVNSNHSQVDITEAGSQRQQKR